MSAINVLRKVLPIYVVGSGSYGAYRGYTYNNRKGKINGLSSVSHSNITNMVTTSIISIFTLPLEVPKIVRRYTRNIDPKDDNDLL